MSHSKRRLFSCQMWLIDRKASLDGYQSITWGREPLGMNADVIIGKKEEAFTMRCRLLCS